MARLVRLLEPEPDAAFGMNQVLPGHLADGGFAVALEGMRSSNLGLAVDKGHQPTAQELAALGDDIIRIRYDDT